MRSIGHPLSCLLFLLLLGAAAELRAQPCPLAPAEIVYDGEGDPLESRHLWVPENGASISPGPEAGTARVHGGLYFNISELLDDPSLTWFRLSGRLRIDGYEPHVQYSGAVLGAAAAGMEFGFYFIEQAGVQRVVPVEGGLGVSGEYRGDITPVDFEFADGSFHDYLFEIDLGTGQYRAIIDAEEIFTGPVEQLAAAAGDPEEWMSGVPGGAFFGGGAGDGGALAELVVDHVMHQACLTDCIARGRGSLAVEGDAALTDDAWPPWFDGEYGVNAAQVPGGGVLTWVVAPEVAGEGGGATLQRPVFSELGEQVEMTVRMRQLTAQAAPLTAPQMTTAFGFLQHDHMVMAALLDRGDGNRSVHLNSGELDVLGDVTAEYPVDWTEFHEYRLVESAVDPFVRLFVDGVEAAKLHRNKLPREDLQSAESFLLLSQAQDQAVITEWDHVRADFRRDGFEEVCDGLDNDCDGRIDDLGSDEDGDGIGLYCDNCPGRANPSQTDANGNGIGDVCEIHERCGDGVVEPPVAAPPCTNPGKKTSVRTRAELDAWIADPSTSLQVKDTIDLGGDDLALVTNCDISVDGPGALINADDLLLSAGTIDLHDDVKATGRVELRAAVEIIQRNPSQIYGPVRELVFEAPLVRGHSEVSVSDLLCVESDRFEMQSGIYDVTGALVIIQTGDTFDLNSELAGAAGVFVSAGGDLSLGETARISDAPQVSLITPSTLTVAGLVESCGEVRVDAGEVQVVAGGALDLNLRVGLAVAGLLESSGSIGENGDVSVCTAEYLLHPGHDFDDNADCRMFGSPSPGTEPLVGCTLRGVCLTPPSFLPAPPGCGVTGGQGGGLGLGLLTVALLLRGRRTRAR